MTGMSIGEVARRAGVAPSAIRYDQRVGLRPAPARAGGGRRYDATALDWLALVALARVAGFTMGEARALVAGFPPDTPPADRWRALATGKLAEVDAVVARSERMRVVLRRTLARGCLRIEDCGHCLAATATAAAPTARARAPRAAPSARPGAR